MEYLFYYITQAPNKKCLYANKTQNIAVTTKLSFFKKKNSTGTIILKYLILIVVIIFFCETTQPL